MGNLNRKLFFKIYNVTGKYPLCENIATVFAKYISGIYMPIYFLTLLYLFFKDKNKFLFTLFVPMAVLIISTLLRKALGKKRPFAKENVISRIKHKNNGSLPSNHAASSLIIALCTGFVNVYVMCLLIIFSFFTGLSRIMCGVHYPLDVFCGWALSVFCYCIASVIYM
ncbi:MAG: phosphatase PAP2 family protein [Firmicutes bacterium]|nr:phosphatase PAP2 family protein [Bacillota bacterium]